MMEINLQEQPSRAVRLLTTRSPQVQRLISAGPPGRLFVGIVLMPWLRISDDFGSHPKVVMVGPLGMAIHIRVMCHCARHLTDGFFHESLVESVCADLVPIEYEMSQGSMSLPFEIAQKWIKRLVDAGLWEPDKQAGWLLIHDYLDYNPTRKDVLRDREATKQRVEKHRFSKRFSNANVTPLQSECNGDVTAMKRRCNTPPVPVPVPVPINTTTPPLPPRGEDEGFLKFWTAYPRKVGKGAALKVWSSLKPDVSLVTTMLKTLAWQRDTPQWTKEEGQFVPHPQTWLRQRRWEDEPEGGGEDESVRRFHEQNRKAIEEGRKLYGIKEEL